MVNGLDWVGLGKGRAHSLSLLELTFSKGDVDRKDLAHASPPLRCLPTSVYSRSDPLFKQFLNMWRA